MHMADALISPAVGGTMWIVTAGLIAYCARKVKQTTQDNLVPMMGVLGAFIFAAQMINFSIPGTGSSGHLSGGLILSVLLGPYAAFLVIASVLTVQAFFFADGGLLALGCNIFNLGFYPAFIAYPFIYRAIARNEYGTTRAWIAAIVAAIVGLQLGAFSVVLETRTSGISALPFGAFILLMLPIHLAIGIVEGLATVAIVSFVTKARPEVLAAASETVSEVGRTPRNAGQALWFTTLTAWVSRSPSDDSVRPPAVAKPAMAGIGRSQPGALLRRSRPGTPHPTNFKIPIHQAALLAAAVIIGGVVSWFASTHPDGLEWSIAKVTGKEVYPPETVSEVTGETDGSEAGLHKGLAQLQKKTALLPDYDFKSTTAAPEGGNAQPESKWPAVSAGTSVSGIIGGLITLGLAGLVGFALKARRTTTQPNSKHEIRNPKQIRNQNI